MRSVLILVTLMLMLAVPASALTLIAENNDVATISSGDVFDNVVMFDDSSITMDGGTVTGHFLMLDNAIATFSGGSVSNLEVFGLALATVLIQPGTLVIDGSATPEPVTLFSTDCPACTVAATLANGDLVGPVPLSVLQSGQVQIQAVPEPNPLLLMGLGLIGLTFSGLKRVPC